ncbi:Crotonyl-CoA reductase [bacterium HR39]|nr:Crotonyl-CoA reductase [bacterium HR39]
MNREQVERIIRKFGSQQRVAELLGIWQTAVSGWIRRGTIPARRQQQLLEVARREGIDLRPEDFFAEVDGDGRDTATQAGQATVALASTFHVSAPANGSVNGGEHRTMTTAPTTGTPLGLERAPAYVRPTKDLYEIGEIPPLGHVPKNMYAWVIRKERHGEPIHAMQQEVVPVWDIGEDECLVMVMAAGVNYNGVWASLGKPISPLDGHKHPYHIAGSDASGIVWAVGSKVKRWKVGDEVVIHCNQDDGDDEECNGGDPMLSPSQRIWGYETPDGSFAQFCRVQSRQLMPRPRHLTWEESGCYVLTLATAYRMLFGHPPHTLKPGDNVLVWGGAGGLGSMAIQLIAASGANAIAVISDEGKREFVMSLGAKGAINRREFSCWGEMPDPMDREAWSAWIKEARRFGKAIWEITGGQDVDIVFEHPGAATFPVSVFVVKRGGMVVICAGTTGYKLTLDARYLWMRQKRVQGSHFAHLKQAAAANRFVINRQVDPCMSEVFSWNDIPRAHQKMMKNEHKPGNMAVLVQARRPGMRTLEEAMED